MYGSHKNSLEPDVRIDFVNAAAGGKHSSILLAVLCIFIAWWVDVCHDAPVSVGTTLSRVFSPEPDSDLNELLSSARIPGSNNKFNGCFILWLSAPI